MNYKSNTNNQDIKKFIFNIQQYFLKATHSIHKARNELKNISYKNKAYIIKSFKVPHLLNKVVYTFFRDSKAKKSYENSMKIIQFVPQPTGYIEFKKYGLIHDSYFISENFNYDFTIRQAIDNSRTESYETLFKAFALFTYQLHEKGVEHLDYSPGNILIKKKNNEYIFKVVDVNRMNFKTFTLDDRLKNFSKLWLLEKDMRIIIKEYAKLINKDENYCIEKAIYFSEKNKNIKNFKKWLKGKKLDD